MLLQKQIRCMLNDSTFKACGNMLFLFLLRFFLLLLIGCKGWQVNLPVDVNIQQIKRENAALLILVENKSTRRIKITYPISRGMLRKGQHTIFRLPQAGNHKIVITAYAEDPNSRDVYQPVATVEIPVFSNGYDVVRAKGTFVGYYLAVTDGMLFPNK